MDIASTLLEYGAKPNAESKNGFTPLHLAAQEGHVDMVSLLLEHEADVNCRAKVNVFLYCRVIYLIYLLNSVECYAFALKKCWCSVLSSANTVTTCWLKNVCM